MTQRSLLAALAATADANGGSTFCTAGRPARLLTDGLVVVVARVPAPRPAGSRARMRERYAITAAGRAALAGQGAPARLPFADLRAAYLGFGLRPGYSTRREETRGSRQDRAFAASVRSSWAYVTAMLRAGLRPASEPTA